MPGSITEFTEEKGVRIVAALREGRRPSSAASVVGHSRASIYNWRRDHPQFAQAWDEAIAQATDRVEEVVYGLALAGDLQAARYWLRHHRPNPYDRETLMKLGILQAALTAQQAQGSGGRVVIDIGPDGLPLALSGASADDVRSGAPLEPISVFAVPANGREDESHPVCDGSGRCYPLPRKARAILDGDMCVKLIADGVAVPAGAIPLLWRRIQAYNALAAASQPAGFERVRPNGCDTFDVEEQTITEG